PPRTSRAPRERRRSATGRPTRSPPRAARRRGRAAPSTAGRRTARRAPRRTPAARRVPRGPACGVSRVARRDDLHPLPLGARVQRRVVHRLDRDQRQVEAPEVAGVQAQLDALGLAGLQVEVARDAVVAYVLVVEAVPLRALRQVEALIVDLPARGEDL